jgi:hypothetical protein
MGQTNPPTTPPPLDPLLQLMVTQPSIEVAENIEATATFDPPIVRPGEKAIYRVTFNALNDSVQFPDTVPAPTELQFRSSARGQVLVPGDNRLKPQTTINYHVRGTTAGTFSVPQFPVQVYGRTVVVPATQLEINPRAVPPPVATLQFEPAQTNVYVGQPVSFRVLLRSGTGNVAQGVQDLKLNGDGFLVDLAAARQSITVQRFNGNNVPTYSYETTLTPLTSGTLVISAQGFTAGNRFAGPVIIQGQVTIPGGPPQFRLVDSDPVSIHVRPLPRAERSVAFTGAIGQFSLDPPQLSTNRVRAGEMLKLSVTIRGEGNLSRLVPPPEPKTNSWQTFPPQVEGPSTPTVSVPPMHGSAVTFAYTLVPLSTNVTATPPIPFSYFDPIVGRYVDLTIPSVPVTVLPGNIELDSATLTAISERPKDAESKPELSDLTDTPGRTVTSLLPLQLRRWFVAAQIIPALGFLALWQWDRRRRFLEQNPGILVRRRARRELRRQKRQLQHAIRNRDERGFASCAITAMRVATAPHFPAEPRALVSSDVLQILGPDAQNRLTVRQLFAAANTAEFSNEPQPIDVLKLAPAFDNLLKELEEKL